MNKPLRIVSGARASGKLHIGNYLGALKQWVELQNAGNECFFFIADLHGITTPFEPKELRENTLDVAATYLAAGIDPKKSVFFLQSLVQEHTELAWIFNCITPLGELERMTQFKDKSSLNNPIKSEKDKYIDRLIGKKEFTEKDKYLQKVVKKYSVNAGLLTYPTLMAADILMYKPTAVPVGDDQTQHVELTRIVARKFNNQFGQTFPEPKTYLTKPLRIMSLQDPTKKMSKTGDEALLLDDPADEIMLKLKKAVTATEGGEKSAGVENLFFLLEQFGDKNEAADFRQQQKNNTIKFSELKETLAKNIADYFAEFREKKKKLLERPDDLAEILAEGSKKARVVAQETMREVKEKVGLL